MKFHTVFAIFLACWVSASASTDEWITVANKILAGTGLTTAQITEFVTKVGAVPANERQQAVKDWVNAIADPQTKTAVQAKMEEMEQLFAGVPKLITEMFAAFAKYNVTNGTLTTTATDARATWQATHSFAEVQKVVVADINKSGLSQAQLELLRADLVNVFNNYKTENPGIIDRMKEWFHKTFG